MPSIAVAGEFFFKVEKKRWGSEKKRARRSSVQCACTHYAPVVALAVSGPPAAATVMSPCLNPTAIDCAQKMAQ